MATVTQRVMATADAQGECTVDIQVNDTNNTIIGATMTNGCATVRTLTVTRRSTGQVITVVCQPGQTISRNFPGGLPHFRASWPLEGDVSFQLG